GGVLKGGGAGGGGGSGGVVGGGARAARRKPPKIFAYVRLAVGDAGLARLRKEADRYAAIPAYAANFARMGVDPITTAIAVSRPEMIGSALARWRGVVDEGVLRAIPGEGTVEETLTLVRAAATRGRRGRRTPARRRPASPPTAPTTRDRVRRRARS